MGYRCLHCGNDFDDERDCPRCGCGQIDKVERLRATKKQLRQYLSLKRELERESERLSAMAARGEQDGELYELVENNRMKCSAQLLKTKRFIYSIDDAMLRGIFDLRYIQGLKWDGVAAHMGGYCTGDYARILHDRYLARVLKDGQEIF